VIEVIEPDPAAQALDAPATPSVPIDTRVNVASATNRNLRRAAGMTLPPLDDLFEGAQHARQPGHCLDLIAARSDRTALGLRHGRWRGRTRERFRQLLTSYLIAAIHVSRHGCMS
jgi:hypothetical protein